MSQKMFVLDACLSGAGCDVTTMASSMMDTLSLGEGTLTITSWGVELVIPRLTRGIRSCHWWETAWGIRV